MGLARGTLAERRLHRGVGGAPGRGLPYRRRLSAAPDLGLSFTVLRVLAMILSLSLLPLFSASGECCGPEPPILVWAVNGSDEGHVDGIFVRVEPVWVSVNGVVVDDAGLSFSTPTGTMQGLLAALTQQRKLWESISRKPFPGICHLIVAPETDAGTVKRVLLTAAEAGCTNTGFIVNKWDRKSVY